MKKPSVRIRLVRAFSLLVLGAASPLMAQTNLFTNGDLETGPTGTFGGTASNVATETAPGNSSQIPGWQFISVANGYGQADVVSDSGNQFLVFQRGASWPTATSINSGWGATVAPAVTENRIYMLAVDIKAPGASYAGGGAAGHNAQLVLEYRPTNFSSSQLSTRTVNYATTNNWQTVGYTTASPSSAAYIRTLVQLASNNTSVAIDNLQFKDVTYDANRLVNGGFDQGTLSGWKKTSEQGSFWHNATYGVGGTGVAHLRNTSNQDAVASLDEDARVAVLSGEENLILTFDARQHVVNETNGSAADKHLTVTIRQYDSSSSLLSELVTQNFNPSTTFSTFALDLPALSVSAAFLDVEFSLDGDGAVVDYFIDNVSLFHASNIPEPAQAAMLLGFAGLAGAMIRRSRR